MISVYHVCDDIYYDINNGCLCALKNGNWLRLNLDELEEKAKREKHLREGMERLEEKLKKKKLEDHMSEHVAAVLHELRHAMYNHPDDKWPWKSFDFVHQTAVMMEEAGEAVRAANNMRTGDEDQMALYAELAQTAAMCIRIMQQIKEYTINGKSSDQVPSF